VRARVTLAAVAFVLVAGVAVGWLLEHRAASTAAASTSGSYRVRVTQDGRELASFDLAGLKAVGSKTVMAQGSPQVGPLLLDVLKRAGVAKFSAITVLGAGTRDSGRLELEAADVGTDTVLAVAKRGTVKVAGPTIPSTKRVRDVKEIQVR
jgi:hypothetical protein